MFGRASTRPSQPPPSMLRRFFSFLSPPPRVFVAYRRDDAYGYAGRMYADLREKLAGNIQMDLHTFTIGSAFQEQALSTVRSSDVLLVLIGKRWADAQHAVRLAEPADLLRNEIVAALHAGVPVVPVLIDGASLPKTDDLPQSLRPLLQQQAFELTERHWDADLRDLVAGLRQLRRRRGGETGTHVRFLPSRSSRILVLLLLFATLATTYGGIRWQARQKSLAADAQRVFDREGFFDRYESYFGDLQEPARGRLDSLLMQMMGDQYMHDPRYRAYLLATIKHETGDTWQPLDFDTAGVLETITDSSGTSHTNNYHARGYIPMAGLDTYRRFAEVLTDGDPEAPEFRLLYKPDLALKPEVAYLLASGGMYHGLFTGKKLTDYIGSHDSDYYRARAVVDEGMNQAREIAESAVTFEDILRETMPRPEWIVTAVRLNMRAGAGANYPVQGRPLRRGAVVYEVDAKADWRLVKVGGSQRTGWVSIQFLTRTR